MLFETYGFTATNVSTSSLSSPVAERWGALSSSVRPLAAGSVALPKAPTSPASPPPCSTGPRRLHHDDRRVSIHLIHGGSPPNYNCLRVRRADWKEHARLSKRFAGLLLTPCRRFAAARLRRGLAALKQGEYHAEQCSWVDSGPSPPSVRMGGKQKGRFPKWASHSSRSIGPDPV